MPEFRTGFTFTMQDTLTAGTFGIKLPFAFMPRQVSLYASNTNTGTVKIGTIASDAALMAAKDVGDAVALEYGDSDFADSDYQFAKGDTMLATVAIGGTPPTDLVIHISGLVGA